jgi:hypothetical protein
LVHVQLFVVELPIHPARMSKSRSKSKSNEAAGQFSEQSLSRAV